MPTWAKFDSYSLSISGALPTGTTSAIFDVTAMSSTGAATILSIPVSSYPCEVKNCMTCQSANLCDTCSVYSTLSSNTCLCESENCDECTTAKCNTCKSSYAIHIEGHCIFNDALVSGTSITSTTAVGLTMGSSLASGLMTSGTSGNFWNVFNALQVIQMIALIELPYPEKLDQFFHGFEFSMLHTPDALNFVNLNLMEAGRDRPFSRRMESFGFTSSYFLILQVALYTILVFVLSLQTIVSICYRCTKNSEEELAGKVPRCLAKFTKLFPVIYF